MNNILFVFLGGGIGSLLRYGIGEAVKANFKTTFPVATLCSNVISCIILALTVAYFSGKAEVSTGVRSFIIIGVCGGFSTFSTFSFETVELMRSGNVAFAISNILISVIVCFALIWVIVK